MMLVVRLKKLHKKQQEIRIVDVVAFLLLVPLMLGGRCQESQLRACVLLSLWCDSFYIVIFL
jgi:hypothetical protein